ALARLADDHPLKDNPQKGDELFDVVDEADQVVRQATRRDVHANGWLHRAIHVFAFNKNGELFLQKRSHLKDVHPSTWDSSAAGHLDAGESYESAVVRELEEELGIEESPPEYVATLPPSDATGWEHVKLYRVQASKRLRYPYSEIETGGFFDLEMIEHWIARRPQDFASGFIKCFQVFQKST
ncbi:MAG: NUDIX hydrolase, partial [Verrucomicrobiales bacterium]